MFSGRPSGTIATTEQPNYFTKAFYAVQKNSWMDVDVWETYVNKVLSPLLTEPSVLIYDNLRFNKNKAFQALLLKFNCIGKSLPKNTTSTTQPLDVNFIGLFKAKLEKDSVLHGNLQGTAQDKRMAIV